MSEPTTIDERMVAREIEHHRREAKALVAWSNTFLKQRKMETASLRDFSDGVLLVNLVELGFKTKLGKYSISPRLPFHKLENVGLCFGYLEKTQKIILLGIDPNDVVMQNERQVVRVLWNIMRKMVMTAVGDEEQEAGGKKKDMRTTMLKWLHNFLGDNSILGTIKDFWAAFQDGLAFCHIVENLCPGNIDLAALKKDQAEHNLTLAFTTAEDKLGIPALLEASDLAADKKPDEGSVINYLCLLVSAAQGRTKSAAELAKQRKREAEKLAAKEAEAEEVQKRLNAQLAEKKAKEQEQEKQLADMQSKLEAFHAKQLEAQKAHAGAEETLSNELAEVQALVVKERKEREEERQTFNQSFEEMQKTVVQEQQAMASSFASERAELNAKLEAAQAANQQLKKQLAEQQAAAAQTQADLESNVTDLTASLYRAHREHEEVVSNFRGRMKKEAFQKRVTEGNEADKFQKLLEESADQEKGFQDFITSLPDQETWLMRKRPDNLLKKGSSKRYFILKGDTLYYNKKKDTATNLKKGAHAIKLGAFMHIDRSQLKNPNRKAIRAEVRGGRKGGRRHSVSMIDKHGSEAIVLVPLDPKDKKSRSLQISCIPAEERDPAHPTIQHLYDWVGTLNTRISLVQYLDGGKNFALMARGGREFIKFVCDESQSELRVEDKAADLSHALSHFRDALVHREDLRLVLNNVALTDDHMELLGSIVQDSKTMKVLNLSRNSLTAKGAAVLAKALTKNKSLVELRLDNNQIGDEGLALIADAICDHPGLCTLSVAGNSIGDKGVMSLCTAIVKNKQQKGDNLSLGDIDFSENVIGDAACSSLSQMILAMPNVHALRLDANTITDAGVEFLCDVIGLGKTGITAMFLADNQLSSKGLGKLASVLEKTTGNLSIDVSGNALISRQGVDAILKASKEGALEFVHFHIRRRDNDAAKSPVGKSAPPTQVESPRVARTKPPEPEEKQSGEKPEEPADAEDTDSEGSGPGEDGDGVDF